MSAGLSQIIIRDPGRLINDRAEMGPGYFVVKFFSRINAVDDKIPGRQLRVRAMFFLREEVKPEL
jgi:hypothetical protein